MEKLEWKMGKSEFSGSSRRGTHKRGFDEARGCHSGCAPTPGFEQAGRQTRGGAAGGSLDAGAAGCRAGRAPLFKLPFAAVRPPRSSPSRTVTR